MELTPFWSALKLAIENKLKSSGIESPEESHIKEQLEQLLPVMAGAFEIVVDPVLEEASLRTMLARIPVRMQTGKSLVDNRVPHRPWVDERDLAWECWEAYEQLLFEKGYPGDVVRTIGFDTRRILDLLGDPRATGDSDRRGLVLGHVQSGKTSNYAGLVCRAADAGYKLFIIIAGIHENLRSQTQQRMDAAFVNLAPMKPISLTTETSDFVRTLAETRIPSQAVGTSLILVVKKNATVLRKLRDWLEENSRPGSSWSDMPLLLVDDEADNASINTNSQETNPTTINRLIRSILKNFRKSSYVGYTATPFANIFIDPESNDEMAGQDLFPRDFIYCLEPADNYIGPDRTFQIHDEDTPSPFLREIDDAENLMPRSHKSTYVPTTLPGSLQDALKLFLLGCAVRVLQGAGNTHMSMLVNVSPYSKVQRQVGILIDEALNRSRNIIRSSALMPRQQAEFWDNLYGLYAKEYGGWAPPWEETRRALPEAVLQARVAVINSSSQDRLNYNDNRESGLRVIAVGGYTLSRGLTLENLMISYWNRNSKAYDTLMQMGRWFGFRDGYDNLCRIWMPLDAQGWYGHITEAIGELRSDLVDMSRRGMTPEDFGLKVRNHPETLIITARNKMRAGSKMTVRPDLANCLIETHTVWSDSGISNENIAAIESLVRHALSLGPGECVEKSPSGSRLWRAVPDSFVRSFFKTFKTHRKLPFTDNEYLFTWLDALQDSLRSNGSDLDWDVLLVSLSEFGNDRRHELAGISIVKQRRLIGGRVVREPGQKKLTPIPYDPATDDLRDGWRIGNKMRVASRGIEKRPLSPAVSAQIEERLKSEGCKNIPDREYRKALERPLLMLHLLDLFPSKDSSAEPLFLNVPAWGASFPDYGKLKIRAREYTVNPVWLQQYRPADVEADEEED